MNKNLKPFQPGNKFGKGRPRKYFSKFKSKGYTQSEVSDCLLVFLSMTEKEVKEIVAHPEATALEIMVCKALESSIKRGSLDVLELILNRAYGKPKQVNSIEGREPVEIIFTPLEIEKKLSEIFEA